MNLIRRIMKRSRDNKLRQFNQFLAPGPAGKVLEVGVNDGVNDIECSPVDNYLVKKYPYDYQLTALGIGSLDSFKSRYPKVNTVLYAGDEFPFADKAFDVAHSNAVLEHVGDRSAQKLFIVEMARVSSSGMLTTPNKYFPFELHTRTPLLHMMLSKNNFDKYLTFIGKKMGHRELYEFAG